VAVLVELPPWRQEQGLSGGRSSEQVHVDVAVGGAVAGHSSVVVSSAVVQAHPQK
jgi:hypothetical protein